MSHVRYTHWNVKRSDVYYPKPWGAFHDLVEDEETLGHRMYDLRFYAGCKRQPQVIRKERLYWSYGQAWGHHAGVAAMYAREQSGMHRTAVRAYRQDIIKAYRAGDDLDDYLEPEGRTRHRALWDAW